MTGFFEPAKLRQHRQEQAAHGFPLLRACPNTSAIARITFLVTLAPAEREDFAKQLSCLEYEQASRAPPTHADFQEMARGPPPRSVFWRKQRPSSATGHGTRHSPGSSEADGKASGGVR